jgi:3-deoxy-7-phosphoheptulonate synthase
MSPEELNRVLDGETICVTRLTLVVNPDRIPGKVTIIGRYGADKVEKYLPAHIDAVKSTDHVVVWQCDAMVGTRVIELIVARQVSNTSRAN